jgi:hypothetical protein
MRIFFKACEALTRKVMNVIMGEKPERELVRVDGKLYVKGIATIYCTAYDGYMSCEVAVIATNKEKLLTLGPVEVPTRDSLTVQDIELLFPLTLE